MAPGITTPGTRSSRPVDLTCLYPTLTHLCELPTPSGLDGVDITPLLREPDLYWDKPAIIDFLYGNTAIRTENWRYIRYDEGRAGEELYNLSRDPEEWDNLIQESPNSASPFRRWLPGAAKEVPTKGAYHFDLEAYSWEASNLEYKGVQILFLRGRED